MRDSDALDNNPHVSRPALEAIHSQVLGWALSRCNYDQATAEDLVQQAYVELLSGRAQFQRQSTLKTFVFGIVQNLARSRLRRVATRLRLVETWLPTDSAVTTDDAAIASDFNPLWQAVRELPARQRDIIELVFCRELSVEEASTVMGVTAGTGRVHYDRAKKALRRKLGPEFVNET